MTTISQAQRKVLEGRVRGSKPGAGMYPATVWKLTSGENVTRTVDALIAKGLLAQAAGRVTVTEAGRSALASI